MATLSNYQEYTRQAIENFVGKTADANRYLLVDAARDLKPEKVLDVGCGAGQELIPFIEKTNAFCVGIDAAAELAPVTNGFFSEFGEKNRVAFTRSIGENLPFADQSFDVVLCRVALPYMHNRRAISEVARVLKPNGVYLLKTQAPLFYAGMLRARWKLFSLRQIAYPLICLAGGAWHSLTGRQLQTGFWEGKEIYQTERFLRREFAVNDLRIEGHLADTNAETPSFVVRKVKSKK